MTESIDIQWLEVKFKGANGPGAGMIKSGRGLTADILVVFKDFTMSLPLTRRRAKYFPDD